MSSEHPSEWDLIDWIVRQAQDLPPSLIKSIGDDCAAFHPGFADKWAISTDMMLEDVHFRRHWISPGFLGRKSLAVSLSDLAAVGARPYACLLNLALPGDLAGPYFQAFLKGFLREGSKWRTPLIGGDLSRSERICVGVTVLGSFEGTEPAWRSAAQPGDQVVLVGDIGFSRLGLEMLQREDWNHLFHVDNETELRQVAGDPFRYHCLRSHLAPEPLIQVGTWLCENHMVNAMIDVSDGLAADLFHIARQSRLEGTIDLDRLPLPAHKVGELDPRDAALDGGEDYALLFTVSPAKLKEFTPAYPGDFPSFRVIGEMSPGRPGVFLRQAGKRTAYEPKGFDHFR